MATRCGSKVGVPRHSCFSRDSAARCERAIESRVRQAALAEVAEGLSDYADEEAEAAEAGWLAACLDEADGRRSFPLSLELV